MAEQQFGSFNPKDHSEGGFFDNRIGTIVDAKVVIFDYKGKSPAVCALHVEIQPDDAESAEDHRQEYYKIGTPEQATPSSDGQFFVPVEAGWAMNKGVKCSLFMAMLEKNGFDFSKLAKGVKGIIGIRAMWNVVKMPPVKQQDGTMKDASILVPTKFLEPLAGGPKPGTAAKPAAAKPAAAKPAAAKPAAAKPAAAKPAPAPAAAEAPAEEAPVEEATEETPAEEGGFDPEARLTEIIMELISEKGGKAAKTLIPPKVFKGVPDQHERAKVMALLKGDTWLGAGVEVRGWALNGGELSFPE